MRGAVLRHGGVLALFALLTAAMTWPLVCDLQRTIPHPGDPFIVSWFIDWTFHAATQKPSQLFHGNIFHPLRYTIAFSENLLGIAPLTWPLLALGVAPLTVYNIAKFLAFMFAGYGAAVLGRHVSGSWLAGIGAGIFFAFVPWRFTHLTHLQLLWTVWLPLLIVAALRLAQTPSWRNAAMYALAFFMNGATNLHWLSFGLVAASLVSLIAALSHQTFRAWLARFIAATTAGLALVAPLLWPYYGARQLYGMRGDPGETLHYSGTLDGWLISSLHNRVWRWLTNDGSVEPERWLFPGVVAPLLALAGFALAFRKQRAYAWSGATLIVVGFLGSLGLNTLFGRVLFDFVPLFRGIRVPARWAMIVYLGVALLAALALARIAQRGRAAAIAICALLLLELRAAPIRWYLTTGETPPVYTWLRDDADRGPIVELPMRQDDVYPYMLHATVHHRPLINGVSGFKPPHMIELERLAMDDFEAFLTRVQELGATTLVAHAEIPASSRLALVQQFADGDAVYRIGKRGAIARRQEKRNELLRPVHWQLIEGALVVEGRTDAVRAELLFDNARDRLPASVENGRFHARIEERPSNIKCDTDLVVELIDRNGRRTRLPQVWLQWYRPNEPRPRGPLPQTAELGALR